MGKQSSRMYGIKVKEKVNYYDVGTTGDVESGCAISISFSNGIWTVKAGAHGHQTAPQNIEWWMNGVQFQNGDTITTFNDGDNVEYHIMEQHRDTIPYVNYMYDVYGNSSRYVKYGTNDMIYRVLPNDTQYSCKVYRLVNGVIESSKVIKSDDVITYKNKNQGKKLPVYNMLFDWHGQNPETGYPQMSFEAISNTNYIKYHTNPVSKGETIQVFQTEGFTGFEVTDDSDKYTAKNVGKDVNPTVQLIKRRGGSVICEAIKDKVSIISDKYYDHKEAYYNGHYHKAMFLVYDNPSKEVDCWKKKVKDLAFTYADPYWFLMTTANGVEYNGTTYEARKLIRSWKPDTAVNMTLKRTISRTKEVAEDEYYDKFLYSVFSEDGNDSIGIYYKQSVAVDDGEGNVTEEWRIIDSTAFDSSAELPVKYKKLLFNVEDGYWKIYSKAAHITYCGETYKSNKLIASFPVTGSFSGDIGDDTAKYNNSTYDHIVYDIEESENVDQVTVKKQRVTTVQDAQGHNHKEYADLDTKTFTSSDQNVIFHNIQFKVRGNFWTIYSKCGYIKFNGRTYLNNRSILNFNIAERIHIEISDDSDKYEVQEVRTYNVKTPNSSVVTIYEVHTSELTREMKIVKSNGTEEEPWISLKSYEAEYVPYIVDDLSFLYFNKTRTWEMYSNNDSLYINGTNYKIGDLIASWGYLENFKMSGITVTNLSTDSIQLTYSIKSSKGIITNNSIDEDISMYDEEEPDFNVSYSYSKGLWVLKALRDAWCEGIRYAEGQIIKSFKTRVNVNPFSILCQHDDEGTQVNITYNISIDVDAFTGETALRVHTYGKPDQVFSDKDISKNGEEAMLFTKDKLKSMYGYIWKKLGSPGPTPTPDFDLLISICYGYRGGNATFNSYLMRYDLRSTTIDCDRSYSNTGSYYLFYLLNHKTSHGTRIFAVLDMYFADTMPSWGNLRLAWTDNFGQSWKFNMTNFQSYIYGNNNKYFNIHVCDRTHVYQLIPAGTMYSERETTAVRFLKYTMFDNGDLSTDIDEIITADESQYGYDFSFIVNFAHTTYIEDTIYFDNYCVNIGHRNDPVFSGFYDYDLLNHSVITVYRDALKNFQDYLNITYASYSEDGTTKTWIYFANYWYDTYSDGTIYARTEDNRPPAGTSSSICENRLRIADVSFTIGSISFVYYKIKIHRTIEENGYTIRTEVIEDLGNFVFRYDHLNKSVSTSSISDSEMIDLTFKLGYSLKYKGNYYGFVDFQGSILLSKLNLSTGTCEIIKTFEPGSYILVKYFDESSSYQNKFIKLYLVTDIADREYLTYDSTNTYRCKIRPEELNTGGYETYSTVAAIHKINYRDSASNCNDKFIFKVANGDRDFKGAIFVFDNINLEGLNVAFRDDYYY